MTLIEFYDKVDIENIAGTLLCEPERTILIGDKRRRMERAVEMYGTVLAARGITTKIECRTVNKNDIRELCALLSQIVEEHDDCDFNLTGGDEVYLVAVGMLMERYPGRLQCHRFNFTTETVIDCDMDGRVCADKTVDISVREGILIAGGWMLDDYVGDTPIYEWEFTPDFERDIDLMWEICRENPQRWNAHASTLGAICRHFEDEDSPYVWFDIAAAEEVLSENEERFLWQDDVLFELDRRNLIYNLDRQEGTVSFTFKNAQVKHSLTVAGRVLELVVAKAMRAIADKDGTPYYNDVRVGVALDWDFYADEGRQTVNEIDVLAMRGVVPVFVSCKNGYVETAELYKLNTVADRFGGKYARKVLVTTSLDRQGEQADYLRARAEDMQIRLIEITEETDTKDLERALRLI